jgi:hypothetical protein
MSWPDHYPYTAQGDSLFDFKLSFICSVHTEADGVSGTLNKDHEREANFIFVPLWWLIKLSLGYRFKFDLNAMCAQVLAAQYEKLQRKWALL